MWFDIDPRQDTPLYQQLVQNVKAAIAKGVLSEGDRLPSVRDLAGMIHVNPNTIAKSYRELEREGIIETLRGRGTFVAVQSIQGSREEKKAMLKEKLQPILVEAHYLDIDEEEMAAFIEEIIRDWYRERRKGS
ncbi:GntR family transcriptional regulator [Desmospora profundinema]|uniref:GntR family transcriptional regulator n=1 Tax=Desmospora profundinema TaxID=1571184 RepID=A0ABU1IPN9_9BACL|nr:GntR family transcriptional regulator [Desmospora profundinema]MDR6226686.1 GntR family transcriptional regulator [Desmospora profundinema]